jgi:hypothetical protein
MEISNEEDLEQFGRLLERLRQAGYGLGGNMTIVYVARGAQHVDNIQTQNVYADKRQDKPKVNRQDEETIIDKDTPLSALFRENSHEELRQIIDGWRQYLIDDDASVDALAMTRFKFDKKRIYSNRVYYELLDLEANGALKVSLSQLSSYLANYTNLSSSYATLYRQLKKYRQERS